MSTEEFDAEPLKTWVRKNYNTDLLPKGRGSERARAEMETTRDLSKPIEQLVCDFHDMAEAVIDRNSAKPEDVNWHLIHAQKRMVSLMGRVALEHKRSSDSLVRLTRVLMFLTVVLLLFTAYLSYDAYLKSKTDEKQQLNNRQKEQTKP
jgi:hypothetical protein